MDIVFASLESWDEIWRRNQFLCAGLLRRHPQMRILFVEPPRDFSSAVRTGRWHLIRPPGPSPAEFAGRLHCFRPWKLLPNGNPSGLRFNEWFMSQQVLGQMRKMAFQRPLLWINAHSAGHLAGHLGESATIYDVTDDWTELKQCARGAALTRRQDAELCRVADAVIVCSERLAELKKPVAATVRLIPNGVDVEHYRNVSEENAPLPKESLEWEKPVFGYTGTLHPDRLDLELIEDLARRLSRGSIVLVGPSFLLPEQVARLKACGNIHLPGSVPYERIPEMMRAFDVCIVPHLVSAFTESLNPIKLWEYLAAGKPIVSTPVAGFRDFPNLVHLANGSAKFAEAMEGALKEGFTLSKARQREAAGNSWEKRIDDVEEVISKALSGVEEQEFAPLDNV